VPTKPLPVPKKCDVVPHRRATLTRQCWRSFRSWSNDYTGEQSRWRCPSRRRVCSLEHRRSSASVASTSARCRLGFTRRLRCYSSITWCGASCRSSYLRRSSTWRILQPCRDAARPWSENVRLSRSTDKAGASFAPVHEPCITRCEARWIACRVPCTRRWRSLLEGSVAQRRGAELLQIDEFSRSTGEQPFRVWLELTAPRERQNHACCCRGHRCSESEMTHA